MAPPDTRTRVTSVVLRTQPDARLVLLAREGQAPAQEEIVRRHRPALVRFAAGIVPAHRAEDVVQESLTRALAALRDSTAEIALRPWLYTIVRNRAFNDLRDEPIHDVLDDRIDGVPQPPDVAAGREELASLVTRMKDLPDAQRQALVQRELEGRSHQEIAASMGASPGAVRQLIFRARASLRAAGFLVPTPLVRYLSDWGSAAAGTAGLGAGGGIGLKAGAILAVGTLAVGSGVAINDRSGDGDHQATAATEVPGRQAHQGVAGAAPLAAPAEGSEPGDDSSGSDDGDSDGDESGPSDSSGPGEGGGESNSGPGGDSGSEEESADELVPVDSSGPGPGDSSGSGSGESGSGDSGSGDSGSGHSGPG
jgi:RNA polymerase sigma factor (sigma-70 family)